MQTATANQSTTGLPATLYQDARKQINADRVARGLRPLSQDEVDNIVNSTFIHLMPAGTVYDQAKLKELTDEVNTTQEIEGCPTLTEDEVESAVKISFGVSPQ